MCERIEVLCRCRTPCLFREQVLRAQALPTLLLFREGRMVDRVEGVMAEVPLAKRVRYYVGRMDKKFGRQ